MKKVAIVQSNYITRKGYFDLIACVDEFILFDGMQYTRRNWRNHNKIKTTQGLQSLTVPVKVAGKFDQKIIDILIDGISWSPLPPSQQVLQGFVEIQQPYYQKCYQIYESKRLAS
jgi:hypothetical protein